MYVGVNELHPEQLAAGRLQGVQGGTTDPALFDQQFGKQFVLDVPYQGRALEYENPQALMSEGMRDLRRLAMSDLKEDPSDVSKILIRELREQHPEKYAGLPEYNTLAYDRKFPIVDASVRNPGDFAQSLRQHYTGVPESLEQDLQEAVRNYGKRFAGEKEVVFDEPLSLADARVFSQGDYAPEGGLPFKQVKKWSELAPGQRELPGIAAPEFNYHATPQSNANSIAELGLRPEQGGKNFSFAKNKDRVFMSDAEDADMWAEKLKDLAGEEPLRLRTTAPSQQVPGASTAVKTRTEPVAPERIQYRNPEGDWRGVKELKQAEPTSGLSKEDQLKMWMAFMAGGAGLKGATE